MEVAAFAADSAVIASSFVCAHFRRAFTAARQSPAAFASQSRYAAFRVGASNVHAGTCGGEGEQGSLELLGSGVCVCEWRAQLP